MSRALTLTLTKPVSESKPLRTPYRLNMDNQQKVWHPATKPLTFKYGVRSPKFIWAPVNSCTHCTPPSPAFGLIYEGVIGQPR
jgi:hypothetical protein